MTTCTRPGCAGAIDETGYCDTCGREAETALPPEASSRRSRTGDPFSLPVFDFPDPSSRIFSDPKVPDRVRRCGSCAKDALPAQGAGHCLACGAPFSFLPSLKADVLVGDQYRVAGCFARGGLGWIYLGHDTRLDDNPVVLKGLIDAGDVDLADAERRALTAIDHPNIVRIFNFVRHPDAHTSVERDYIVMEYVEGMVLSEVAEQSRHGKLPLGEPLRTEHVITCGLQILSAFDYLHSRGLLYCDLKPDNVIVRSGRHGERGNRVKLIDLGAVRRVDDRDSRAVGTPIYQVSDAEIAEHGLTVRSDLHTVGETLHQLYLATADRTGLHGAGMDQRRIKVGVESFRRVCARARHTDLHRRFDSAAEMAEQLRGVQREIASLRDGQARHERSTVFAPTARLLDDGLGDVPKLSRWTDRDPDIELTDVVFDSGRPTPSAVAIGLPVPFVAEDDPAADFLLAAAGDDPRRLLDKLETAGLNTVEAALARCRATLATDDHAAAAACRDQARALLPRDADWRLWWHDGLLALATGDMREAERSFDAVYAEIPGEDAPKLALAFCAEHAGRLGRAEDYYTAVWRRDRTVASAAFGLARVRLAQGERAEAVTLLDETPAVSRHFDAARIAAVKVLSGTLGDQRPTSENLRSAETRLAALYLDGGAATGPLRTRLHAVVQEAELGVLLAADADTDRTRVRLETSYRALARQADTRAHHSDLVDLANQHRPITFR